MIKSYGENLPDRYYVEEFSDQINIIQDTKSDLKIFAKKEEKGEKREIYKQLLHDGGPFLIKLGYNEPYTYYDFYGKNLYEMIIEFIYNTNQIDIVNMSRIMIYALYRLNAMEIIHADLHLKNILFNLVSGNIKHKYKIMNKEFEITTDFEVVISDFEYATVVGDKNYNNTIVSFYKNYFPLVFYMDITNCMKMNYKYIDLWRFLKTFTTVLYANYTKGSKPLLRQLTRFLHEIEFYLTTYAENGKPVAEMLLIIMETLTLEHERMELREQI